MSALVIPMSTPAIPSQPTSCCPGCGYNLPALEETHANLLEAQAKISELENQVRLLNEKATAAVDRWADYEDELTRLRAQLPQDQNQHDAPQPQLHPQPPPQPTTPTNPRMSFLQSSTSRLSTLLSPRKSTPELRNLDTRHGHRNASSPLPSPSPSNEDLLEALSREQNLRKEAETQVAVTRDEIEELSAALFEQANQMVAEERRARAKLEERVGELERRDQEKRGRLEKLESAMSRIQRVRELLAEPDIPSPIVESAKNDDLQSEGHTSDEELDEKEKRESKHRDTQQYDKQLPDIPQIDVQQRDSKQMDEIERPNEPIAV